MYLGNLFSFFAFAVFVFGADASRDRRRCSAAAEQMEARAAGCSLLFSTLKPFCCPLVHLCHVYETEVGVAN